MGDQYTAGQVGAMGRGARAQDNTFQQVWNQLAPGLDFEALGSELERLRVAMKAEATTGEHDLAVAEIAKTEIAVGEKQGPKALEHLKAAGQWALDVSVKVGTGVATAALKAALGIPG